MKFVILFFLLPVPVIANACAAVANGLWSANSTWTSCGAVVPHNGDTAFIDGFTVTLNSSEIVGNSPAAGTVVLNFGSTGLLIINSGGYLKRSEEHTSELQS